MTPLFMVNVYSPSTCTLVWVTAIHKVVMVSFQARGSLQFHQAPSLHPSTVDRFKSGDM